MEDKPQVILDLERALGIDHVDHYRWDGENVTELKINNKQLKDIEKAKSLYEQVLFNHEYSIYFIDARKKFRQLRGDANL